VKTAKRSTKSRKRTTAGRRTMRSSSTSGPGAGGAAPRGDRSKRLLDLVMLLLRARSPVAFREIREQFAAYQTKNVEAGLRAFERDKADLLELGVPIRYITPDEDDALEEGGYVVDLKRLRLPEVHLTPEEVSALVLAASVARAVPGDSYGQIVDLALKKLAFDAHELPDTPMEFPLPRRAITRREPVLVHFPAPAQKTRELSDAFSRLEAATRNRKRVTFRYRAASTGYVQERELDPFGLIYRRGAWLAVGHCHLRKDVRSFRLDRMGEVVLAPRPKSPDFERPENFDIRAYANRSPWTFQPEPSEEVELEIRPEAASTANEDFGPTAQREELAGGAVRVRFSCGNPEYVVSRVLSAKGGLVLCAGDRVRERLTHELEAVAGFYEGA
jgi:predicted DNA-binding transcriptional regulator YafY